MTGGRYEPRPATDELIEQLRETAADYAAGFGDRGGHAAMWGLNLTGFMGERMGTVLARLDAEVRENGRFRDALERIAQEPAPGTTVSCRNIAKTALQDL